MKLGKSPKVSKLVSMDLETALYHYTMTKEKQDPGQMWHKICSFEKVEIENMQYRPHRLLQLFWKQKKTVLISLDYS